MNGRRGVLWLGLGVLLLFGVLFAVASVSGSRWDAAVAGGFGTVLVFGGVAQIMFWRAFRRTLMLGNALPFILGPRPADDTERQAWQWGRAFCYSVAVAFTAALAMWIVNAW
jgi:hypothetical protein